MVEAQGIRFEFPLKKFLTKRGGTFGFMEAWNREDLYGKVWEQPLVKIAAGYGISAVMLGKVCRKLQIPLPGRGYWVKKEFGKPVQRVPLPEAKNLPVVQRFKQPVAPGASPVQAPAPQPEPTDAEYVRIKEVESHTVVVNAEGKRHKFVVATGKALRHARVDRYGFLEKPWNQACLDLRVSKVSLERALNVANAVLLALEAEKFQVSTEPGKHAISAQIFGQHISFTIVEKRREKSRREVQVTPTWTRSEIEYEPNGELEFRPSGSGHGRKLRDGKRQRLEDLLPQCVGALLREARDRIIAAEQAKQREIERRERERARWELSQQVAAEEKKVQELELWVENWAKARQMREFIAALERLWTQEGHDLSPEGPKGQRIVWMKQQADRLDPMLPSPPSILDRKRETFW